MNTDTMETSAAALSVAQKKTADKSNKVAASPAPQPAGMPRRKPIEGRNGRLANFQRNCWAVIAPDDMELEAFSDPDVWLYVSRDYQMWDRVEIIQSRRWSEGIVCDVGHGYAYVKVLQSIDLPQRRAGAAMALPHGYTIRPGAPDESPFVVIRDKDSWVMNRDNRHHSFEEARKWLLDLAIFR